MMHPILTPSLNYVICERKKYVDNDIIKLKLFPLFLRDRAKT